jgi:hypothetical protein
MTPSFEIQPICVDHPKRQPAKSSGGCTGLQHVLSEMSIPTKARPFLRGPKSRSLRLARRYVFPSLIFASIIANSKQEQLRQAYKMRRRLLHQHNEPILGKGERCMIRQPKDLSLPFSSGIYLPLIEIMEEEEGEQEELRRPRKSERILKCPL